MELWRRGEGKEEERRGGEGMGWEGMGGEGTTVTIPVGRASYRLASRPDCL